MSETKRVGPRIAKKLGYVFVFYTDVDCSQPPYVLINNQPTPIDRLREMLAEHGGVWVGGFNGIGGDLVRAKFAFKDETVALHATTLIALETGLRLHRVRTKKRPQVVRAPAA